MFKVLYGNLRYRRPLDIFILPIKYIWVVYTLPTIVFVFLLTFRSGGAFGNPIIEEFGTIKKVLFRCSVVFISFVVWGIIFSIVNDNIS